MAHRLLFLSTLAAGNCTQPNPAFLTALQHDASITADVADRPDTTPDALIDAVSSPVEPPGADGSGPPDSPLGAGIDSRPDIATDIASEGAADVLQAPTLVLDKVVYTVGEEIVTTFSNGPGYAADWIGIYDESAPTPSDDNRSLLWYYTDNQGWNDRAPGPGPKDGTVRFGPGSRGSRQWPLPAGRYKAIFLSAPHILLTAPVYFQVR